MQHECDFSDVLCDGGLMRLPISVQLYSQVASYATEMLAKQTKAERCFSNQ